MSQLVIPNVFVAGTDASAAQVNANFDAVVDVINGNLDGTNLSSVFDALTLAEPGGCKFPGGLIVNWGQVTQVPADNTAGVQANYVYPYAAVSNIFGQWLTARRGYSPSGNIGVAIGLYAASQGTGGFTIWAAGGPTGNLIGTVAWLVLGF